MPFSVPTMFLVNTVRLNRSNPLERARSLSKLWTGRFMVYLVSGVGFVTYINGDHLKSNNTR